MRTNDQIILEKLEEVNSKVQECVHSNHMLRTQLEELKSEQENHENSIREVIITFEQARGIIWFIKMCAAIMASIWAVALAIKELLSWKTGA